MAAAVMVDPKTAGASACHLFPTTEILAMLNVPVRPGCPGKGLIEKRISLMADQLDAVAELIFNGTRTNFHPVKSKRLAPTLGSKVMLPALGAIEPLLA